MEIQRVALEDAKEARDKANKRIDDFFYCMIRYAQKNAQVSATASEVAEAALSACQFDLELYKMSISHYHFCMGSVNATSIKSLDWARDRAEEKARLDAQELAEEGKRRVINILVKMRQ